jgi:acyl-CoA thioesterase
MPSTFQPSAALQRFLSLNIPYWSTIGMEVLATSLGEATVRVRYSTGLLNANGVVHGGVVFSAADAAVAVALHSLLKAAERITTIEMKINFMAAVDRQDVLAEARILHRGSRTAVGEATVRDGAGKLVAKGLATYAIAPAGSEDLRAPAVRLKKPRSPRRRPPRE